MTPRFHHERRTWLNTRPKLNVITFNWIYRFYVGFICYLITPGSYVIVQARKNNRRSIEIFLLEVLTQTTRRHQIRPFVIQRRKRNVFKIWYILTMLTNAMMPRSRCGGGRATAAHCWGLGFGRSCIKVPEGQPHPPHGVNPHVHRGDCFHLKRLRFFSEFIFWAFDEIILHLFAVRYFGTALKMCGILFLRGFNILHNKLFRGLNNTFASNPWVSSNQSKHRLRSSLHFL